MRDARGAAFVVKDDLGHRAARTRRAAFCLHHADKAPAQRARAASDVGAAAGEIAALGDRVEQPPQPVGIVGVVAEVRRERKLGRLVVAEQVLECLGEAEPHVVQQWP